MFFSPPEDPLTKPNSSLKQNKEFKTRRLTNKVPPLRTALLHRQQKKKSWPKNKWHQAAAHLSAQLDFSSPCFSPHYASPCSHTQLSQTLTPQKKPYQKHIPTLLHQPSSLTLITPYPSPSTSSPKICSFSSSFVARSFLFSVVYVYGISLFLSFLFEVALKELPFSLTTELPATKSLSFRL